MGEKETLTPKQLIEGAKIEEGKVRLPDGTRMSQQEFKIYQKQNGADTEGSTLSENTGSKRTLLG